MRRLAFCTFGDTHTKMATSIPTVAQTVMKTVRLNSGAVLPQLGLGTWKIPAERTAHIVKEAIRVGFTHLGGG
jgi:hypothetical protein